MSEYKKRLAQDAKKNAIQNLKNHTVEQYHNDGDQCRLWRCSNDGSSVYHFWVCAPPGWLIVYGDMGECMWSRTSDMIAFARQSIESHDYFASKASRDSTIREVNPELAREWLSNVLKEWNDDYGRKPTAKEKDIVASLREWWEDYGDPVGLRMQIYESGLFSDCEGIPSFEFYTYSYLWRCEAIKWFLGKLDSSSFVRRVAKEIVTNE